PN
ncbi:DNA polymerase III, alpha subunit, partial [Chlamydia psittaci 84-8471/1]